jgi:hypothetical protein
MEFVSDFEKDRFDALMKLAEFKRAVRDGRRQFEWKFSASAFVALVGLSAFPKDAPPIIIVLAVAAILMLHIYWVYWNQSRSEPERVEMYRYKDAAEKMLLGSTQYKDNKQMPFYKQLACWFQIITACALGCFSIAVRIFG